MPGRGKLEKKIDVCARDSEPFFLQREVINHTQTGEYIEKRSREIGTLLVEFQDVTM